MTFRNKHSFIGGFLCAALFISGGCALGGCTEITEPQGIDEAGNRPSLTVRATASDFVSCVQEDDPVTRTPTENGYTTEFNNGDAIGIFAIRGIGSAGATLVDETDNCKLVCTVAADGTRSWAPAAGDTHVVYSYDETITYVAYYPYRDGITIDPAGTADEIIKSLAGNANLQPATDQSTPAAYTGSDLMAALATPTTDPSDANKKVLTLAFEHLHALLVFKPSEGFLRYVSPDGGFEYRDEARELLGSLAAEATINNIKACPMGDGSFRVIIPTPLADAAFTPSGNYRLTDGKNFLFTGPQLAAGTLIAGKYYTLVTNSQLGTKTRGVQSGDFFYRDGKLLNADVSVIPDPTNCVGIVLVSASGNDTNYGGNCVNNTIHGHVVSVYDVANCKWGPEGNIGTNTSDSWGDFRGYLITQRMKEDGDTNYGGFSPSNYAAAYYCLNYGNTDRGRLTATKTSGWYFPSEGFMRRWAILSWGDINGSLIRLVSAGYGQNIGENSYYWDASTLSSNATARIVKLNPGEMSYYDNRGNSHKVRAVLTF